MEASLFEATVVPHAEKNPPPSPGGPGSGKRWTALKAKTHCGVRARSRLPNRWMKAFVASCQVFVFAAQRKHKIRAQHISQRHISMLPQAWASCIGREQNLQWCDYGRFPQAFSRPDLERPKYTKQFRPLVVASPA
jgi:hypothetical protein